MSNLQLSHGRVLSTDLYRAIQVTATEQTELFTKLAELTSDDNPGGGLFIETLNFTFNDEPGETERYEATITVCL